MLDLPHLEQVLAGIQAGEIEVVAVESLRPSPVAQGLLWSFASVYMYEWDTPKAERQLQTLAAQADLLQDLLKADLLQDLLKDVALDQLLRPEAVVEVRSRLQHTAPTSLVRSAEELAVLLQQMGDLSSSEIAQSAAVDPSRWVSQLAGQNRIVLLSIPTAHGPAERWVAADYLPDYTAAFALPSPTSPPTDQSTTYQSTNLPVYQSTNLPSALSILTRHLRHAGPVTVDAIRRRYDFPIDWLQTEAASPPPILIHHSSFIAPSSSTARLWSRSTAAPSPSCARRCSLRRSASTPISWPAGSTCTRPSSWKAPAR